MLNPTGPLQKGDIVLIYRVNGREIDLAAIHELARLANLQGLASRRIGFDAVSNCDRYLVEAAPITLAEAEALRMMGENTEVEA